VRSTGLLIIACFLLLGIMAAALFTSARGESPTWDEPGHLTEGYAYLKTGNFWYDQVHAPLPRLLAGLPLLAVEARVPTDHVSWRTYDFDAFRHVSLYRNRVPPDTIMMLGRLPTMALTLLLGLVLALWTRRHFGLPAALAALTLYALDPNFLAFGRYTTTDVHTVAVMFVAVIVWARYLETLRKRDLLLASVVVGVALATKYSMLFLFGLLPLLYAIRWWQEPRRLSWLRLAASMVCLGVVGLLVVGIVYWPITSQVFFEGGYSPMVDHIDPSTPLGSQFHWLAETFHLPAHPYLHGLYYLSNTNAGGTPSYLLGEVYSGGRWSFFPVALAVKSTSAFLAALAISLGIVIGVLAGRGPEHHLRKIPFAWFVVTVPPAVYFALALTANLNSGVRYIMPIYPFLFAFIGAVLGGAVSQPWLRKARWALAGVLAAALIAESALAYPHYLAFFNEPSGGSRNGHEYLVNTSLDWGQEVKHLKAYLDAEGIDEVCLSYFGQSDPDYYGIRSRYLPTTGERDLRRNLDCVAAVSVTHLVGLYIVPGSYDWLRDLEPMARIGYSINVYDLRKTSPGGD
jgi:4-amino-4-deoxy-L-arabinose transferase-like glycosyltransferase